MKPSLDFTCNYFLKGQIAQEHLKHLHAHSLTSNQIVTTSNFNCFSVLLYETRSFPKYQLDYTSLGIFSYYVDIAVTLIHSFVLFNWHISQGYQIGNLRHA